MTAQILDLVTLDDTDYALVGKKGPALFIPSKHCIRLGSDTTDTACWRGFHCRYGIRNNRLRLVDLTTISQPKGLLNGVIATDADRRGFVYRDAELTIKFTGTLRIGRDLIRGLYFQGKRQPGWDYEKVLELTFSDGMLQDKADISESVAEERALHATDRSTVKYTMEDLEDIKHLLVDNIE